MVVRIFDMPPTSCLNSAAASFLHQFVSPASCHPVGSSFFRIAVPTLALSLSLSLSLSLFLGFFLRATTHVAILGLAGLCIAGEVGGPLSVDNPFNNNNNNDAQHTGHADDLAWKYT